MGCGALVGLFWFNGLAQAGLPAEGENAEPWNEAEVAFPPAPQEEGLVSFYVSATTPNTFLVDLNALTVGADDVVRFVLVVRSPHGAENVTFEGIRCSTGERRLYAIGQSDGSWVASRDPSWIQISFNTYNRARAALALDYFCSGKAPNGIEEIRRRIVRGGS